MTRSLHCRCAALLACLFFTTFATAAQGPQAPPATLPSGSRTDLSRRVDDSIARAVKFLLDNQNADGSWGDSSNTVDIRVGETALVALALLNCGESHQSPQLTKTIKYLRNTKPVGLYATYAVSLRACVWATVPE